MLILEGRNAFSSVKSQKTVSQMSNFLTVQIRTVVLELKM